VAVSSLAGKAGVLHAAATLPASTRRPAFSTHRIELAPYGVSVTVVYPGFVATGVRERAFGPDGLPLGSSPVQEEKVMAPETCARLILQAAARRRREEVMTLRGRLGQWLKLVAPGLVDRVAARAIEKGI
jgi:short-subunit dehydrogenase